MFKVAVDESYWATVEVHIPADAGKSDVRKFKAKLKRLSQPELDKLNTELAAGNLDDETVVSRTLLDWEDVQAADGSALPFNPDTLAQVMAIYPVRPSIVQTFFKTINGARQKN